jgi:hypothetical protein
MVENDQPKYPHIIVPDASRTSERYTSVRPGRGDFVVKARNRRLHGSALRAQLNAIDQAREALAEQRQAVGIQSNVGITLQFESEPGFEMKVESLDNQTRDIQLLNVVKTDDNKTLATVSVPEGKIAHFFKLVDDYLEKETKKEQPRHNPLIANIAAIRLATLNALWTDTAAPFPGPDEILWWEVWLRAGKNDPEKENFMQAFREVAQHADLTITDNEIEFPERMVVLMRGTSTQLSQSVFLLNSMAEVRKADSADSFMSMEPVEEAEWLQEALRRIAPPAADSPAVCVLDTGVNNGHPLIQRLLSVADTQSYNPGWGTADHEGHGTEMAGLAVYGDLFDVMIGQDPIALSHRLESVKILPPGGSNDPSLYGKVTAESVARAEIQAPDRQRAICMAITTTDSRDRGQPSSWSASVDQICSGSMEDGEPKRLMVLSAGNADAKHWENYPNSNYTDGIHDPAQAWNALTVGAYTEKEYIDQTQWNGCTPLAPKGGLCPHSTTSLIWNRQWPLKPDIVLEGGNVAFNPALNSAFQVDSLHLLSTNWQPQNGLFSPMCATSASSALASRMAATTMAKYPALWPETIRGLMVHSAKWTDQMTTGKNLADKTVVGEMLRIYGHGVPTLEDALWSAGNSLTLIAQDFIQPFFMDGSRVKTRELRLHSLPWPGDILAGLGNTEVQMRVTLSYFIEPNPGQRGWLRRFLYPSHGLRFHMKTGTESLNEFRGRINKVVREEVADDYVGTQDDFAHWLLGYSLRSRGSIHSDTWKGPAVTLAEKGFVAVFPVSGWWRERTHLGRYANRARYSLIVSIKTPPQTVDIYTPVAVTIPV